MTIPSPDPSHASPEAVSYEADGVLMQGFLFRPTAAAPQNKAAVLLFPAIFGPGQHARARAARLADLGYTVFVSDIHGNGQTFERLEDAMAAMKPVRADPTPQPLRRRAEGALTTLLAHTGGDASRVVAVGFCFGGTLAQELARGGASLAGVVGFHTGITSKEKGSAKNITCPVLILNGADDPTVSQDNRETFESEMRDAGVDWQMHLYGGVVHGYTDPGIDHQGKPEMVRYDARADRRSWATFMDFLKETVGNPAQPSAA